MERSIQSITTKDSKNEYKLTIYDHDNTTGSVKVAISVNDTPDGIMTYDPVSIMYSNSYLPNILKRVFLMEFYRDPWNNYQLIRQAFKTDCSKPLSVINTFSTRLLGIDLFNWAEESNIAYTVTRFVSVPNEGRHPRMLLTKIKYEMTASNLSTTISMADEYSDPPGSEHQTYAKDILSLTRNWTVNPSFDMVTEYHWNDIKKFASFPKRYLVPTKE